MKITKGKRGRSIPIVRDGQQIGTLKVLAVKGSYVSLALDCPGVILVPNFPQTEADAIDFQEESVQKDN